MKRLATVLALLWVLVWPGAVNADSGIQWDYTTTFTHQQSVVLARMYEYADFHGLRDEDRDLFIRLGYRETRLGENIYGDYSGGVALSLGVMQWYRYGVWQSTPCFREYGWTGRLNLEADLFCGAWAIKAGYASHWRPWERVRWLYTIPPDPRPWLWGGPHPPTETIPLTTLVNDK
jgi:hypothetical protein